MSNFAIEIFDDESPKCLFYTVKLDGQDHSETEKFFAKYYQIEKFKTYTEELANFLSRTIGIKRGAINDFFRD